MNFLFEKLEIECENDLDHSLIRHTNVMRIFLIILINRI